MSNKNNGNIRQLRGQQKQTNKQRIAQNLKNLENMKKEAQIENIIRVSKVLFAVCQRIEKVKSGSIIINQHTYDKFLSWITRVQDYNEWHLRTDILNNLVAQIDDKNIVPSEEIILQECTRRLSIIAKSTNNEKTSNINVALRNKSKGIEEEE